MTRITEQRDVQDRLIHYLQGQQWTFIPRFDLPAWRGNSEREPFLLDVLHRQLTKLNGWPDGDARSATLLRRLRLLPANLDGNEQFLHALRNQWTAYDPAQQREFDVTFVDYDHLAANEFHFTEEMWVQESAAAVQRFVAASLARLPQPEPVTMPLTVAEVHALVSRWAARLHVTVAGVQVRAMRGKWGSISTAGTLTLADDIRRLPPDLAEYVVVHELLHLRYPDHRRGWRVSMGVHLPDWNRRAELLGAHVMSKMGDL